MKDTDIRNIIIKNIEYIRNTFDKVYQINFDKNITSMQVKSMPLNKGMSSSICVGLIPETIISYDPDFNKLHLYKQNFERVIKKYNDKEYYLISKLILHSLIHMASTDRDKKLSGINNGKENNTALNEAITELLSVMAYPKCDLASSPLCFETMLCSELAVVVSPKHLFNSYFNFHKFFFLSI